MKRPVAVAVGMAACTGPASDTGTVVDTARTDTDGAAVVRPPLTQPAAAVDVDPDPHVLETTLTAAPAAVLVGDATVDGYAYNGQVPGPTLRAEVGDLLVVHLVNDLDVPTTIHWHGAGAPYPMDGVPWQRSPVMPGGEQTYTFRVEHAGTFWYHPHFDTQHQVDLGLYGVLVVTDPDEPAYDHDLVLVLDAWGEALAEGEDADDHPHGLEGTALTWTVNGAVDPVLTLPAGDTARLRWVDASNTGYVALQGDGLTLLAGDQGVVTAPRDGEPVVLAPGDRAEHALGVAADLDVLASPFSLHGGATWGAPWRVLTVAAEGEGAPSLPAWSVPVTPPSPDPGTTTVTYTLQGDPHTGQWRINHEAFPDVTIAEVPEGERVVVEVRNLSPTHHPFHGHGHAFEVLAIDGTAPPIKTVEDTIDVPVRGIVRLAYTATRPGDWMQHCHILPHADGGMMTVLRVTPPPEPP
ncbi:MAG: multicopper oxidase family protein [Alphaproteobacteria bacterium]|nr:multicopper oxidase family protein [Alphaproteobacteria bacterium]